jgi:diaminopimelate epimerase
VIILSLNTGSPHHINVLGSDYNVKEKGAAIRYGACTERQEVILILWSKSTKHFCLANLWKRVEDETLACGTGATAVAIAMNANEQQIVYNINVEGGKLVFHLQRIQIFTNVFFFNGSTFCLWRNNYYLSVKFYHDNFKRRYHLLRALEPNDLEFVYAIENDQ